MSDFDFDRFLSIPRLTGLHATADGGRVIVTVDAPAPDGKRMRTSIWAVDPNGARPARRLTRGIAGEASAAFAQDGSLLFCSKRVDPDASDDEDEKERGGLWLLPAEGGEARLLAAPLSGVDDVRAAAQAPVAVFAAEVFPGATLAQDAERHQARKKAGVSAVLFDRYPIRHWDHYLGPRDRHLFVVDLPGADDPAERAVAPRRAEAAADTAAADLPPLRPEPRDLTPDAGGGLVDQLFAVSPDGRTVVATWADTSDLTRIGADLVAIDVATGERRRLAAGNLRFAAPTISPDGRWVAAIAMERDTPDRAGDQTLWLVDLATGEGHDVLPGFDLWPVDPAWAPDGSLVFTADRRGNVAVFRLALDANGAAGEPVLLAAEGEHTCATPTSAGIFALRSDYATPPHVVRLDATSPGEGTRLRSVDELDDVDLPGVVERLRAEASDGQSIESWLVRPKDASAAHPAPLVVWVHGGPLGSWTGWHWRWNPQLLAARGYAVLLPDPAISLGYGIDFVRRGHGRWGEAPFTDVIAAVDGALAERTDLDPSRTALMGGSFGGYMANWVAGQTDRFRAIVTHASLWELRGFHGSTDWGAQWEEEFGDPYADASRYEAANPASHVGRIRTPMLVIHGELDARVPISEALQLWTDLRRHGVESRFLYFPDENHWILKPENARVWYETTLAFLDEHLLGKPFARPELL